MFRTLLIITVVLLSLIGGMAVGLYHYFGWKGLLGLPFLILALLWLGKMVVGSLFKKFAGKLFGMKSEVLKDAAVLLHSITPVAKPPQPERSLEDADGAPEEDESDPNEEASHYFEFDMTITRVSGGDDRIWEPGELILTMDRVVTLEDLSEGEKELGFSAAYQIWEDGAFVDDKVGKMPGSQRLKMTFAVKPRIQRGWLQYYDQPLCEVSLPDWRIS
ncbi:MAG: hypothetical protein FJ405_10735 [Verrucomicrobia bacterium]|nr:hypothetical protein [Verrucomicrobiota bacterium]